ncbi:MAG TPA: Maf family protein, partial [Tepidisphaeraceae bacterium]|nr:Maf family protein [Tepidisphaeraceae bacterium]
MTIATESNLAVESAAAAQPAQQQFVLASASPRRQELLRQAGYQFIVDPANIDEDDFPRDILPSELALKLAQEKADAVAARHPADVVLAADTVVAFGDLILNKPRDAQQARKMLRLLSGTTHIVITAVAVVRLVPGFAQQARVMSAVRMRLLSPREIEQYVESGLWQGKAGGYGIQD